MQKFVITLDGELRFGDVNRHKGLLPMGDNECHGGGFWKIHEGGMSIALYGRSYDYGGPDFSMINSVDWAGIGGKFIPLIYYPNYPELDNPEYIKIY
ncbi:MAG: hypothetical protein K5874_04820 [Bacteroidaceae bacterium]|nr:hypothetical protein [Bacteroidaceae bacterium]